VYNEPLPLTCTECAAPLAGAGWGLCILCRKLFCRRHLVIRKGVPNCAACEEPRRVREQTGGVSPAEEARVVGLLARDLMNTVGSGHEVVVEEAAARIRLFSDAGDFEHRVVDDVQQCVHDTFVDTSWPRCPDHPKHPLWFFERWWTCEQSGKRVALLGGLPNRRDGA
jgi:hypothetical protein